MPLKHKKVIIIKDEKLRKIRDNLRKLWLTAALERKLSFQKRQSEIIERTHKEGLDPSETRSERIGLVKKMWAVEGPLRASICECPICFNYDRDMVYNPITKKWYCEICYNRNHFCLSHLFP